jgi:hypothetical protein
MEAQNVIHVVPAGTFQPVAERDGDRQRDFSFMRAIVREFVEELLGIEELTNQRSDLSDPLENVSVRPVVDKLYDAKVSRIYLTGLGLDPLNTKPELLFVLVTDWQELIERTAFKPSPNLEGRVQFIKLTSADRLLEESKGNKMLAAGAACLRLGHLHFGVLNEQHDLI